MANNHHHHHLFIILVISTIFNQSLQDTINNEVEDANPFSEAASAILKEQNLQNIGGLVNNLLHSGGAKHLGDLLANAAQNGNAAKLLDNVGSVLNQNGVDINAISSLLSQVSQSQQHQQPHGTEEIGLDSVLSFLGSYMGQSGNTDNIMDYLPLVMQTLSSFVGPEADTREKQHSDHAWLLPPLLERFHLLFDHFMNSEAGRRILSTLGGEKFIKIFADDKGNISYQRVVDMLENHSFRKHWIRMVTDRIAVFLDRYSNPEIHRMLLHNVQHFLNSYLKSQGYPKTTMFDPLRPVETLTALFNYFGKHELNRDLNAKQYVQPAVEYIRDLLRLSQKVHAGGDHRQLSDKIADTINLEIIEPIARVNRAYRFATNVPQCDRYVMCLVNDKTSSEKSISLPGLRQSLSKTTSLMLSWFLSGKTGTSFWTLYSIVTEDHNCKAYYKEICEGFHIEEYKVTTEYVHNEL